MISAVRVARRFLSAAIEKSPVTSPTDGPEKSPDEIRERAKKVKEKTKALVELSKAEKEMQEALKKSPLGEKAAAMGEIERARLNTITKIFADAGIPDNAYVSEPEESPTPITIARDIEVEEEFLKNLLDILNLQRAELARGTILDTDDGPLSVDDDMEITGGEFKLKLNGIKANGATFKRGTVFHVNP